MSPIALIDLGNSLGQEIRGPSATDRTIRFKRLNDKTYLSTDNCFGNNRPWAVFDFFSLLAMIKSHNAALS